MFRKAHCRSGMSRRYGHSQLLPVILESIILLNDPEEVGYIKSIKHKIVKPNVDITSHAMEISKSLLSINCFKRACVLYKK